MAVVLEERVTDLEALMGQLLRTVDRNEQERRQSQQRTDQQMAELRLYFRERTWETDRIIAEIREDGKKKDRIIAEIREDGEKYREKADRIIEEIREDGEKYREKADRIIEEIREDGEKYREKADRLIAEIKEEVAEYRRENDKAIKAMRRQVGEQANQMGRLVEDLVAPSIPRIVQEIVKLPDAPIESAIRVKRYNAAGELCEFDAIATCGSYFLINETKSNLTAELVKEFFTKVLPKAREYFAEYKEKQIIGIVSSLYVDESLVRYGERQGLVVLGFGQDVMDVLNSDTFQPKLW